MLTWLRKLWFKYYLRKYTRGQRTSYGFTYSMADILHEADSNPFCPPGVIGMLWAYHTEQLLRIETEALRQA